MQHALRPAVTKTDIDNKRRGQCKLLIQRENTTPNRARSGYDAGTMLANHKDNTYKPALRRVAETARVPYKAAKHVEFTTKRPGRNPGTTRVRSKLPEHLLENERAQPWYDPGMATLNVPTTKPLKR